MEIYINAVLLTLLAVTSVAIIRQRSLVGVVMLAGTYSFLIASVFVVLDAVDVAMTEAAVGAGVSTVIFLIALHLTKSREYPKPRSAIVPLFVTVITGIALVWGTSTLPPFGVADAPIHEHTTPYYLDAAREKRVAANVVTAVLADYRSFDTLGETLVVFTAGIGIMMLLRVRRRRGAVDGSEDEPS